MPKYTIEGKDRGTGLQTKVVITAPTKSEALLQARERDVIPENMESDAEDQREVTFADLVRVVQELQSLRSEQLAAATQIKREIEYAAGSPVVRMLAWLIIIIIGAALGTSLGGVPTIVRSTAQRGSMYYGP